MSDAVYIQTNIVPLLLLFAIYFNLRSNGISKQNRLFARCIVLVIFVLLCDMLAWVFDASQFTGVSQLLLVFNSISFLLGAIISYLWLRYTYAVLAGDKPRTKSLFIVSTIPVLLFCLFVLVNLFTGWLFYIDASGSYTRGPLFIVYTIVTFGYLIAAAVLSLMHAAKSPTKSKKRECLVIASFVVLPVIGAIVQVHGYGLSFVWPLASVSILIVYLGQINQSISLDALTGLNNRGQLDKLLLARCSQAERSVPIYLAILDVNGFKGINDTKGHVIGDKALECISDTLKQAFGATDAFLARYGGDEFSIVSMSPSDAELLDALSVFEHLLATEGQKRIGFPLTVSVGIAKYDVDCDKGVEWFISSADAMMYEQKQNYRKTHLAAKTTAK